MSRLRTHNRRAKRPAETIRRQRAQLEQAWAALRIARQTFREVEHAQRSGANWYTQGASGLYQQVALHLRRGEKAASLSLPPDLPYVDYCDDLARFAE